MTSPLRYTFAIVFLVFHVAVNAQDVHDTTKPKEDLSWLAAIDRPVLELANMKAKYDSAASALVFTDIIVDWVDSADAKVEGHNLRKAVNCLPVGTIKSGPDSAVINPVDARIDLQMDGGNIKVYTIVVPVVPSGESPLPAPVSGELTLVITAAKLVDRSYTVEHTISRNITLDELY